MHSLKGNVLHSTPQLNEGNIRTVLENFSKYMEIINQIRLHADQIKKSEDTINGLVIEKALLGYKPHLDKIITGEIKMPEVLNNMIEFLSCQVIDVHAILMCRVKRSSLEIGPNIMRWDGIFNPVLYTDQPAFIYLE